VARNVHRGWQEIYNTILDIYSKTFRQFFVHTIRG